MELIIMNCSEDLYRGNYDITTVNFGVSQYDGKYCPRRVPFGAVRYLINQTLSLKKEYPHATLVWAVDSKPINKRLMLEAFVAKHPGFGKDDEGYKGQRKERPKEIIAANNLIEKLGEALGINVIRIPDFEADDIIQGLVEIYEFEYDKVIVRNTDRDLFHLVSDNVVMKALMQRKDIRGNVEINMNNYCDAFKQNINMIYCTSLFDKLVHGDSSDNLLGYGKHIIPYLYDGLTTLDKMHLRDLQFSREVLEAQQKKTMYLPDVVEYFNIIAPLYVDRRLLELDTSLTGKESALTWFANDPYSFLQTVEDGDILIEDYYETIHRA